MLRINELKIFTAEKIVLSVPELAIEQGTYTHFHGLNTSGKSLFLMTLSGQYQDYKGEITFKKRKLSHHLNQNNILLINTALPVVEKMTFIENIQLPLGNLTPTQRNRLIEMATIVDLVDLLRVKMIYSSHSERMLMYLLRASLISPGILLIDDIDVFFDKETLAKVLQLFQFCTKSGMIIVTSGKTLVGDASHYMLKSGEIVKICP